MLEAVIEVVHQGWRVHLVWLLLIHPTILLTLSDVQGLCRGPRLEKALAFLADEERVALSLSPLALLHKLFDPLVVEEESLVMVSVLRLSGL